MAPETLSKMEFMIETKGHCFICLNKDERSVRHFSLKYLSRCLNLNGKKMLPDNAKSRVINPMLIRKVERSNVTLCEECFFISDQFTDVYKQLEEIELKVLFLTDLIGRRMEKAEEDGNLSLKPSDVEAFRLAQKVRGQIIQKCSLKLKNSQPRIRLDNVDSGSGPPKLKPQVTITPPAMPLADNDEEHPNSVQNELPSTSEPPRPKRLKKSSVNPILSNQNVRNRLHFKAKKSSKKAEPLRKKSTKRRSKGNLTISKPVSLKIEADPAEGQILDAPSSIVPQILNVYSVDDANNIRQAEPAANTNLVKSEPFEAGVPELEQYPPLMPLDSNDYELDIMNGYDVKVDVNIDKIFRCIMCYRTFENQIKLDSHNKSAHSNRKSCNICGKVFQSAARMKSHFNWYHLNKYYKCSMCFRTFKNQINLNTHFQFSHKKDQVMIANDTDTSNVSSSKTRRAPVLQILASKQVHRHRRSRKRSENLFCKPCNLQFSCMNWSKNYLFIF